MPARWLGAHLLVPGPDDHREAVAARVLVVADAGGQVLGAGQRGWRDGEHVAANERAGACYEREGFTVHHRTPRATGDPAPDQVWWVRAVHALPGHEPRS